MLKAPAKYSQSFYENDIDMMKRRLARLKERHAARQQARGGVPVEVFEAPPEDRPSKENRVSSKRG